MLASRWFHLSFPGNWTRCYLICFHFVVGFIAAPPRLGCGFWIALRLVAHFVMVMEVSTFNVYYRIYELNIYYEYYLIEETG